CTECGLPMPEGARWQVHQERVFRRPDTGGTWTQRELPPGAMYESPWLRSFGVGPDGLALVVVVPGSPAPVHWHVDGPSRSTDTKPNAWKRTGNPKHGDVTARPSILVPGYHGFLTDGVLTNPL